jgi:group I intron endonuclease
MEKVLEIRHKTLFNQSGIYKLIIKNHFYIGSSKNLYYRLKEHLSKLRSNNHKNPHLQNCFNKYGENELLCEIVEICSVNILIEKEKYYIDLLNPNLNVIKNPVNIKISEDSKKKISSSLKSFFINHKPYNKKWDKIKIFNKNGVFIEELTKQELFLKNYCSTKTQFRLIVSVCAGRKKSYNGFIFQFDFDNRQINKLGSKNLSKKYYYEVITKNNEKIELNSNHSIIKFLGENYFEPNESITFTFKQK